jgi:peptidoglycan/xylan/chitin deacetylase (PgdA/CDA1 family)
VRAILTFHSIDESGSVLSYPPRTFNLLLDALDRGSIPILELDELLRPENTCGVALTFDDGIRTVLTEALPILRSHSATAHLFLTTGFVGVSELWFGQLRSTPAFETLRWSEIEALQGMGMRIEAHTAIHPDLSQLSDAAVRAECESADEAIVARLGVRPRYFAYPYGRSNARVRDFARSRYAGSVTTDLRMLRREEDSAKLPRLDAHYLRHRLIFNDLRSPHARGYLAFRRALRGFRSGL